MPSPITVAQAFQDYFTYLDDDGAPVTGKVNGDFTVEVAASTGNVANTGITVTEVDSTDNAGKYRVDMSTGSFLANAGNYSVEIYDTATPTKRFKQEYLVRSGDTYLSTLAEFTATSGDGRVTDGTNPIQGASVILVDGTGAQVAVVYTDINGVYGPVYLNSTVSAYVQSR